MHRLLLVDDNRSLLEGMGEALAREELSITLCDSAEDAVREMSTRDYAVVVTDLKLPGVSGLELLKTVRRDRPEIVVILITAHGTVDVAVEAMKQGAFDFVTKPFNVEELTAKVDKSLDRFELQRRVTTLTEETTILRRELKNRFDSGQIVGASPQMAAIKKNIGQLARSKVAVLILGETGTGKELVARAVHYQSDRAESPFIRVNCAIFTETLLESELFGHERGAFTGAVERKPGRFELADKGTIFLDEIGELSVAAQAKLLRVLQEHEFERVGGTKVVNVDVRVIAATNRDLEEEVKTGRFREDLFYRLNVVPITLPPLRERKGDIPSLIAHFLDRCAQEHHKQITGFTDTAMNAIMAYHWPGNIRELENMIERGVVLSDGEWIHESTLPFAPSGGDGAKTDSGPLAARVEAFEKRVIRESLDGCNGNTTHAADALGMSRSTLRYKIQKYGLLK